MLTSTEEVFLLSGIPENLIMRNSNGKSWESFTSLLTLLSAFYA